MSDAGSTPLAADAVESARQAALLAALWVPGAAPLSCRDGEVGVARGLQAYRANAGAMAARALEAAYPTVCALIGADDFRQLARAHWVQQPPARGDLAEWGQAVGDALDAHEALSEWPYLGDCARVDWAVHQCERAADASFDGASIARLGDTDPQRLRLRLRPGVAVLRSRWPVVQIHEAHRAGAPATALDAARDAIRDGIGEAALVARSGWRAQVVRVDDATAAWTQCLLCGDSLAAAIDAVSARPDAATFDLGTWLAAALGAGWLKEVGVDAD